MQDLAEVSRRTAEAWDRGASEVCLQGGIHPDFTGTPPYDHPNTHRLEFYDCDNRILTLQHTFSGVTAGASEQGARGGGLSASPTSSYSSINNNRNLKCYVNDNWKPLRIYYLSGLIRHCSYPSI